MSSLRLWNKEIIRFIAEDQENKKDIDWAADLVPWPAAR